jgi:hypothetical protein
MSLIEKIKEGLAKFKEPKELWLNPSDEQKVNEEDPNFLKAAGLKIRVFAMMEKGIFLVSENDIEEQWSRELQQFSITGSTEKIIK